MQTGRSLNEREVKTARQAARYWREVRKRIKWKKRLHYVEEGSRTDTVKCKRAIGANCWNQFYANYHIWLALNNLIFWNVSDGAHCMCWNQLATSVNSGWEPSLATRQSVWSTSSFCPADPSAVLWPWLHSANFASPASKVILLCCPTALCLKTFSH